MGRSARAGELMRPPTLLERGWRNAGSSRTGGLAGMECWVPRMAAAPRRPRLIDEADRGQLIPLGRFDDETELCARPWFLAWWLVLDQRCCAPRVSRAPRRDSGPARS